MGGWWMGGWWMGGGTESYSQHPAPQASASTDRSGVPTGSFSPGCLWKLPRGSQASLSVALPAASDPPLSLARPASP